MDTKEIVYMLEEGFDTMGHTLRQELIKRVKAYDHYQEIMNTLKALEIALKIWR